MPDLRKGLRPKYNRYVMTDQYERDGVETSRRTEEVGAEFVINFCSAETRQFFRNLGGTEHYQCNQDRRYIRSTSPDRRTVRSTVFEPVFSSGRRDL